MLRRNLYRLLFFVLVFVAVAYASTKMRDVILTNSTIDSTPIGMTTVAGAQFSTMRVESNAPIAGQGATTNWNISGNGLGGETDFVNHRGLGPGGFAWYNTNTSSPGTAIMLLNSSGILGVSGFNGNTVQASGAINGDTVVGNTAVGGGKGFFTVTGAAATSLGAYTQQGAYLGWNGSGGSGETDFLNSRGGGVGGFRWYNGTNSSTLGTLISTLDASGTFTTGTVVSHLQGNADTASNWNHNPGTCAAPRVSVGTDSAGNAICKAYSQHGSGGGGTIGGNSYASQTITVGFSPGYTNSGYQATCSLVNVSSSVTSNGDAPLYVAGVNGKNGTSVQVIVANGSAHNASWGGVDCTAVGDNPN